MSDILARLAPEVRSYGCGGYRLEYDLRNLSRSLGASVREASVFYAARTLEALSSAALDAMGFKGKPNVFSNLTRLEEFSLLPSHTLYWSHGLRRMGNAVRHAVASITAAEEETALGFLEYWLRWFFCRFAFGPRLADLAADENSSPLIRDEGLRRIMGVIGSDDWAPAEVARDVVEGAYPTARQSPAVLAVLAEAMLRTSRLDEAGEFLKWAVADHPDDLRLGQLQGLCLSRAGLLDEAVEMLEPLYKRYRTDDEMIGIMAGVYKRKWRACDLQRRWLQRSHKAYAAGWQRDEDNTYLGINVATTSLFLDEAELSRTAAAEVRQTLEDRIQALARLSGGASLSLGLWEQLTLAEAELLLGEYDAAAGAFEDAVKKHPEAVGSLGVARDQLLEIAERLKAPEELFDRINKGADRP